MTKQKQAFQNFESQGNHVRIALSEDIRGCFRFDVTVDFPTVEESEKALMEAIDSAKRVMAVKELPEASIEVVKEQHETGKKSSKKHRSYDY